MDNKGKNTKDPKFGHLDIDTTNAASAADFTGIVPVNPQSDGEINSYKDIYNFGNEADRLTDMKRGEKHV